MGATQSPEQQEGKSECEHRGGDPAEHVELSCCARGSSRRTAQGSTRWTGVRHCGNQ